MTRSSPTSLLHTPLMERPLFPELQPCAIVPLSPTWCVPVCLETRLEHCSRILFEPVPLLTRFASRMRLPLFAPRMLATPLPRSRLGRMRSSLYPSGNRRKVSANKKRRLSILPSSSSTDPRPSKRLLLVVAPKLKRLLRPETLVCRVHQSETPQAMVKFFCEWDGLLFMFVQMGCRYC